MILTEAFSYACNATAVQHLCKSLLSAATDRPARRSRTGSAHAKYSVSHHMVNKPFRLLGLAAEHRSRRTTLSPPKRAWLWSRLFKKIPFAVMQRLSGSIATAELLVLLVVLCFQKVSGENADNAFDCLQYGELRAVSSEFCDYKYILHVLVIYLF